MSNTTYALLVGIDQYPAPVNTLHGCVNDIRRIESLLKERIPQKERKIKTLTDQKATRTALIDGFRRHLGKAGKEDVALFYYSGHGSQAPSPPEFWHLEPDRLDETLVCWDSRLPEADHWDLADKELAQLVSEVAERGAHVVVILDCCHSGSGTRGPEAAAEGVRVRRVPTDERLRPLGSFLLSPAQRDLLLTSKRAAEDGGGWYTLPLGRHVVLSACLPEEEAKELSLGGEQRGAFSYFLLDTLKRIDGKLSYRDLFKRVNAMVRARVAAQSPQMEATLFGDVNQPFLGGAIPAGPTYFTLTWEKERWVIDGGEVHGIVAGTAEEKTLLSLFPLNTPLEQLKDLSQSIGKAQVTKVLPTQSVVTATLRQGGTLETDLTYKGIITATPLPPMLVAFEGDNKGITFLRKVLKGTKGGRAASLLVREGKMSEAELIVTADARPDRPHYRIRRKADRYRLVVDSNGLNEESAQLVRQHLEHIARWLKVAELNNSTSRLPADAVRLEILRPDGKGGWQPAPLGKNAQLDYYLDGNKWRQPQFKVRIKNTTANQRLYCMLLDLPESYGIFPDALPKGGVWLEAGQEVWANNGNPMYGEVMPALWAEGVTEFNDILKLIVSTQEAEADLLRQGDLQLSVQRGKEAPRSIKQMNTLNRLMQRTGLRHLNTQPEDSEEYADWMTNEVSFTVVRPLAATNLAKVGEKAVLGHGVTIVGHPELQARARLSNMPHTGRSVGNLMLPSILRDQPEQTQPWEFSRSRDGQPGVSVLELEASQGQAEINYNAVTPEQPLVIQIDQKLDEHDLVMPFAWDGEFFLPLGKVERTDTGVNVILERLPEPTSDGSRDLKGSIKILFQKLIGQRLGFAYHHPVLRVATVHHDGSVTYSADGDLDFVKEKVTGANTILLYIHGITGDTRAMTASAQTAWLKLAHPVTGLQTRYDLILSFDYENLHTTIEENAQLLKQRLEAVGLVAGHSKTLHIVAHSMGGLLSSWFIEREGGNRFVKHLVMLGTPNAGSPWPCVEDWVLATLSLGMNNLLTGWSTYLMSGLVNLLEHVDIALDQMNPTSPFLEELAQSPDPGIPYTIIAGNTKLIDFALQKQANEEASLFDRLWNKIKPKQWFYQTLDAAFFHEPNDIAVSVTSIQSVPRNHSPKPKLVEPVACDHSAYFHTEVSLRIVAETLS